MRIEYVAGKIEINRIPSHPLKTKNRSISHHHQFHRISKSNMKYQYIRLYSQLLIDLKKQHKKSNPLSI